jgi:hypothetical protein
VHDMHMSLTCPFCSVCMQGHIDVHDVGPAFKESKSLTLLDLYHSHAEAPCVIHLDRVPLCLKTLSLQNTRVLNAAKALAR